MCVLFKNNYFVRHFLREEAYPTFSTYNHYFPYSVHAQVCLVWCELRIINFLDQKQVRAQFSKLPTGAEAPCRCRLQHALLLVTRKIREGLHGVKPQKPMVKQS